MFRLIRVFVLMVIVFAAGILVGRGQAQIICAAADGDWHNNTCIGSDLPHD